MNRPLAREQRIVATILAELRKDRPETPRKMLAPDIRRLALDGLDDKAIAALTGASISTVSTTVSRMARVSGGRLARRNGGSLGLLIKLSDEVRAKLGLKAARRDIGVNTLAQKLLEAAIGALGEAI